MIEPGSARVVAQRPLIYTAPGAADRPPHVRAASGMARDGETIYIVQDDAAFVAVLDGEHVTSVALPHAPRDGSKRDKLDLEACVVIGGELWAFGSGSLPTRERILRVRDGVPGLWDASVLYGRLRAALGGRLNIEGVVHVGEELWFLHRGNCDEGDCAAIVRIAFAALHGWLDRDGEAPEVVACARYDLGTIAGTRLGFTDGDVCDGHVYYLAAAEPSAGAIDDAPVAGSQLGVLDVARGAIRATALVGPSGEPIKAEGLVMLSATRALVVVDPDDPMTPAILYEVALSES